MQASARNAIFSDAILTEKAKALAVKMELTDFCASNSWLAGFKDRFKIRCYRPHGESGAADQSGIDTARDVVPKIIREGNFSMDTTYNFDETGLYYRAKPSKTLATGLGQKQELNSSDGMLALRL